MQNVRGAPSGAAAAPDKPSLKSRALGELRQYAVITLYLWVLFAVFSLYRRMILQEHGVGVWQQSFAIVNALVFGKVILIAQALHLEAGLRKYPRIFIVLGNSALFTIVLMAFHILEDAIKAWILGRPLATSIAVFGGGTLSGFLSMGAIFFVALIPFFGIQEVARAVGGRALWDLFFSGRTQTFRLVEE
jgi:predicted outer membrane lipoprotein